MDAARPRATYRLQLRAEFGFRAAAAIVPYLAQLGVSHLYLSPILAAASGSTHGYDVVDHTRLSEELGGEKGFAELVAAAKKHDLRLLVDIVPNHMHVGSGDNRWWWDVLENGPSSRHSTCFDIDWRPPEEKNHNTVLLPVLGDHRGALLERQEIQVVRELGGFVILAPGQRAPVAPRSIARLLALVPADDLTADVRDTLAFLRDAWHDLPRPTVTDAPSRRRRHRDKAVLAKITDRFLADHPEVARRLDAALAAMPKDPDALDAFLDEQNHRLAYWRTAAEELDYRRFFDVNHLVGLRAEDPEVFADTHRLIGQLVADGVVHGLRVDHVDGLADPREYLFRLRALAPTAWIVVEKILAADEQLPPDWPVAGTTGYEHADDLLRLFVDEAGRQQILAAHAEVTGDARPFAVRSRACRQDVLRGVLKSDVERLVELLVGCCAGERRFRDVTRGDLREALIGFLVELPVYRTYLRAGEEPSAVDLERIAGALDRARQAQPGLEPTVFAALSWAMQGGCPRFTVRLQQVSGAAMAKGVEDTAFYATSGYVALHEVGGDPGAGTADAVARFHARREGAAMIATSTHDTKRSEDVRARLAVLSQRPGAWIETTSRWRARNLGKRQGGAPDAELEQLFYQVLVGAWPLSEERAQAYLEKAAREAKTRTSWTRPDEKYEAATKAFVSACYADRELMSDVEAFVTSIATPARVVSLAMTTLKLTVPGVPDLYQGSELEILDLVDPDNRRPVDYERRRRLLAALPGAEEAWRRADEGVAKLLVTARLLDLRRRRPELFDGGYQPILVDGALAFSRTDDLVVAVPLSAETSEARLPLPPGPFSDVFTGARHRDSARLSQIFRDFPVAVLERSSEER